MKPKPDRKVLHYDPEQPCCGSPNCDDLFPDVSQLDRNVENCGRIASIYLKSIGIGIQDRKLTIDGEAWSECVKQPNFQACYDLSMAKLALLDAIAKRSL